MAAARSIRPALSAVLAAFTLAACAMPILRAPDTPETLVIGSWNLEHLAARAGEGCRARTENAFALMREAARPFTGEADVIAFQEVESVAAAHRIFPADAFDILIETRPGSARRTECRGRPGQQLTRQAVGFAIRKGLRHQRHPDLTALQLGDPDLRSGVDVTVYPPGRPPIRLLAVHLKSGCPTGREREACDTLFRQLPILEDWIDARAAEGVRFAVLGDFNRRLAAPDDPFWAAIDDGQPAGADLRLAAGARRPACDPRYGDFIDHIVLGERTGGTPADFEEWRIGPREPRISDHCPISLRVSDE